MGKPNVVLVVMDDTGWDAQVYGPHLEAVGLPAGDAVMPTLAAMAANGELYTDAFGCGTVCSPGRGGTYAGRNPERFGVNSAGESIDPREKTIGHMLAAAGYRTALRGKWHLGHSDGSTTPPAMGFADSIWRDGHFDQDVRWIVGDSHQQTLQTSGDSTLVLAEMARGWIEANAAEPFLLVLAPSGGHFPYVAQQQFLDLYPGIADETYKAFLAELSAVDYAIGVVRAQVAASGVAGNTILGVIGDNGGTWTTGPDGKGKTAPGARIPTVIEWPGVLPQRVVTRPTAGHTDWLPTLASVIDGAVLPQGVIDGEPLWTVVDGLPTTPRPRDRGIGFLKTKLTSGALTWTTLMWVDASGDWRLTKTTTSKLYHRSVDPREQSNVASANPSVVAALGAEALAWFDTGPPGTGVPASLAGEDY